MLRLVALLVVAFALASAAAASAQAMPGMLSVNDGEAVRVASAAAVRRALARCARAGACASVYLETCSLCILSAEARRGGFAITSRLGPPGPEYDLFDRRTERARRRVFNAADMIAIFAGYISGPRPRFVGSIQIRDGM
jgi:hypothetical protein